MPEGPEISYMTYVFNKDYKNSTLENISIVSGRYTHHPKPNGFKEFIEQLPSKIESIKNKGKFIYMTLKNKNILGIKLNYGHLQQDIGKQSHVHFITSKGTFYLDDQRNFATLEVMDEESLQEHLDKIGPDLLHEEVSPIEFETVARKHPKIKIGAFLLEQKYFSGIGNYVRAEALYRAKISPFRLIKDLSDEELKLILKEVIYILKEAFHQLKDHGKHIVKKVYSQKETPKGEEVVREKLGAARNVYWVPSVQK